MRLIKYDNVYNDALSELDWFFDRAFRELPALPRIFGAGQASGFRLDMHQDGDNYFVSAELPGVTKEDINIELDNAVLTISGSRKQKNGESEATTEFSRSLTVGEDVAGDKVQAKLENGILTVTLPKREERKPRTIAVG